MLNNQAEQLSKVKNNYDVLHQFNLAISKGVYVIEVHTSAPVFGGYGSSSYYYYDIATNKYLGNVD